MDIGSQKEAIGRDMLTSTSKGFYVRRIEYRQCSLTRHGAAPFVAIRDQQAERTLTKPWNDKLWAAVADGWTLAHYSG